MGLSSSESAQGQHRGPYSVSSARELYLDLWELDKAIWSLRTRVDLTVPEGALTEEPATNILQGVHLKEPSESRLLETSWAALASQ